MNAPLLRLRDAGALRLDTTGRDRLPTGRLSRAVTRQAREAPANPVVLAGAIESIERDDRAIVESALTGVNTEDSVNRRGAVGVVPIGPPKGDGLVHPTRDTRRQIRTEQVAAMRADHTATRPGNGSVLGTRRKYLPGRGGYH